MAKAKRRRPTRWDDIKPGSNQIETREWPRSGQYAVPNGRSYVLAECPFCKTQMRVFVWSLRGGGKRCTNTECGALLGSSGEAFRLIAEAV